MAVTAEGIVPWPVTRITSASGSFSLVLARICQPVDVVHHQVGDHDVEGVLLDQLDPLRAAGGHGAVVADSLQTLGHGLGVGRLVVDDQHANRRAVDGPALNDFTGQHERR